MTNNIIKLRKLTAEMYALLSVFDLTMRLKGRNSLWTLFVEATKCCRPLLEAWVREKVFLHQDVIMIGAAIEELIDKIEEAALKHLLDQMQGEELNPDYCLGPDDKSFLAYLVKVACKHNFPRDARNKHVVVHDQNRRTQSGRPYLVLATGVDTSTSDGEKNDDGSAFPEYQWGVDGMWLEDVQELQAYDRFISLSDSCKIIILLDKMFNHPLKAFEKAAARCGIDNRFLQPYRRRLSRINRFKNINSIQRIACVMEITEPAARKRLAAAYQKLDSFAGGAFKMARPITRQEAPCPRPPPPTRQCC